MRATIPVGLDRKEAEVYHRLDPARLPRHIAIIMDGNGRWARRRHLPRVAGHRAGVASVRSTVETAARVGIPSLTLYAFSEENWKKPLRWARAVRQSGERIAISPTLSGRTRLSVPPLPKPLLRFSL